MAWCEECARLVDDEDLDDGACPRCGTVLEDRKERSGRRRYPWSLRFMLVASAVYLGYRAYQGITWVAHHV